VILVAGRGSSFGCVVAPIRIILGTMAGWLVADRRAGPEVKNVTLNPYEEAALCRESSRLRDAALRRLDGETMAIGFTPERKGRRLARRSKADTEPVAPAQAMALPSSGHPSRAWMSLRRRWRRDRAGRRLR
jgi:hypothetical protein